MSIRPGRPSSGVRPQGPLVLVVEDDDNLRDLFSTELAAAGFMVLEAADGATAIDKATRFGPHAIVLDLMLPGVDGFKVARRLRSDDRTNNVAIIAFTALTSERIRELAHAAGCDAFMTKPVLPAALVGELVRLLATRRATADMTRVTNR
jgi:two-component system cell cycle response regulator DivK